jgi:hypothetical protein
LDDLARKPKFNQWGYHKERKETIEEKNYQNYNIKLFFGTERTGISKLKGSQNSQHRNRKRVFQCLLVKFQILGLRRGFFFSFSFYHFYLYLLVYTLCHLLPPPTPLPGRSCSALKEAFKSKVGHIKRFKNQYDTGILSIDTGT